MSKLLIASIVIPPLFMFGVIYNYHQAKKQTTDHHLSKEVTYTRPETERNPAQKADSLHKKQVFHEAFSK